ncbi:hypothetical protein SCP_0500780 [Sparassis crispa]|uniref:Uncharacterized protein n=1 Tax=Sparassis crispa TaxID=139825 RepID=A0A401GLI5_9APHY|nr:hypothetical protein SCP_0500780 [Sparassis crispa]GBE83035.1 hypothetical protein SCP_0500780 [Sparassis crispa]
MTLPRITRIHSFKGTKGPYLAEEWAARRLGRRIFPSHHDYTKAVLKDYDAGGRHHPACVAARTADARSRRVLDSVSVARHLAMGEFAVVGIDDNRHTLVDIGCLLHVVPQPPVLEDVHRTFRRCTDFERARLSSVEGTFNLEQWMPKHISDCLRLNCHFVALGPAIATQTVARGLPLIRHHSLTLAHYSYSPDSSAIHDRDFTEAPCVPSTLDLLIHARTASIGMDIDDPDKTLVNDIPVMDFEGVSPTDICVESLNIAPVPFAEATVKCDDEEMQDSFALGSARVTNRVDRVVDPRRRPPQVTTAARVSKSTCTSNITHKDDEMRDDFIIVGSGGVAEKEGRVADPRRLSQSIAADRIPTSIYRDKILNGSFAVEEEAWAGDPCRRPPQATHPALKSTSIKANAFATLGFAPTSGSCNNFDTADGCYTMDKESNMNEEDKAVAIPNSPSPVQISAPVVSNMEDLSNLFMTLGLPTVENYDAESVVVNDDLPIPRPPTPPKPSRSPSRALVLPAIDIGDNDEQLSSDFDNTGSVGLDNMTELNIEQAEDDEDDVPQHEKGRALTAREVLEREVFGSDSEDEDDDSPPLPVLLAVDVIHDDKHLPSNYDYTGSNGDADDDVDDHSALQAEDREGGVEDGQAPEQDDSPPTTTDLEREIFGSDSDDEDEDSPIQSCSIDTLLPCAATFGNMVAHIRAF